MNKFLLSAFAVSSAITCVMGAEAPKPFGAVPHQRQIDWQRMEYYAFVHLGLNTYTGNEWGFGNENPKLYNPKEFDAVKICQLFKDAGMKGVILTAKHHDGFCLWPTKTTEHNITKAPYLDGKADMVRSFADAAKKVGIKFGVYISPWDRNHAEYGEPGYVKAYHEQITELLSGYGDIFEIWFDGANGGDGWYGGKKGTRKIPKGYYDFQKIVEIARKNQPNCVVWGADRYGDARWGGSERGHVNYPHWHTLSSEKGGNGGTGFKGGDLWIPGEGDTSIRSGWFWHERYNNSVKTPAHLMDVWFTCIGRGANLILNVPPDRSGKIYPADEKALLEFKKLRDQLYSKNYADGATATSADVRGGDAKFDASKMLDGDIETYWVANDDMLTPSAEINLKGPQTFDVIRLREQIRLGQRVTNFVVDAWQNGAWKEIYKGSSIGHQHMARLATPVTTEKLRLRITGSMATPTISEISLFRQPVILSAPVIARAKNGNITIKPQGAGVVHYTLDGTEPTTSSPIYKEPLSLPEGGMITAAVFDGDKIGEIAKQSYGIPKANWKIVSATAGDAQKAIDDNPKSFWNTHPNKELPPPQSFIVDMGGELNLGGFTYLPRRDGTTNGMTDRYRFEVSVDGSAWKQVAEGEFSNLRANPIEQIVNFAPEKARYFRFTGLRALDKNHVSAAEIGVLPAKK